MQPLSRTGLLLRILLPALIAPLLAISPAPQMVRQSLSDARQSLVYGHDATAAAHLVHVAQRQPWRSDVWQHAGELALQGGNPQAATSYLEEAARRGQLNPNGRLLLGDAYQQTGETQAAIIQWKTAIVLGAPGAAPHERLATAYQTAGMWQQTQEHLQQAAALSPERADLYFWLGRLLAARRPQAALPYLTLAGELDDSLAPAAGELGRAIRLAAVEEDEVYTLLESGRALAGMGDWQYAMLAFRQAAVLRPDYAPAWAWLAEARQQVEPQSASQLALADLQTALRLDSNSFSTHLFLALYWRRQGDDLQALSHLEAARQIGPETPAVHVELADTLAHLGKLQDALQAYQQAASLQPQTALYQRLLAGFSVRYQYQIVETGLPAARRAVLLAPRDPASLEVMAQVLMLLQDFSSAQRFLARAVHFDPGYLLAQVNLGLLHALQGNLHEARQRWQLVINRSPDSPAAQQARRYLQTYFP
jgi:tetratricopeptide (TPR) repeat protein